MEYRQTISTIIRRCMDCKYHCREQGGVMYCCHRESPSQGYIIDRESMKKFPNRCPLPLKRERL